MTMTDTTTTDPTTMSGSALRLAAEGTDEAAEAAADEIARRADKRAAKRCPVPDAVPAAHTVPAAAPKAPAPAKPAAPKRKAAPKAAKPAPRAVSPIPTGTAGQALDVAVPAAVLRAGLAIAKRAIAKGGCLPGLAGVRIQTTADGLLLAATDLNVTVSHLIPATVAVPGMVLVSPKLLEGAAKGKGDVTLRLIDHRLVVENNGATTELRTLPVDEFPVLSSGAEGTVVPLDLSALAEVMAAASKDLARPILCGVLFTGSEMVATDSYRLHLVRGDVEYPAVPNGSREPQPPLVSAKALAQVIAAKPTGPVTMAVGETDVTVTAGNTTWIIRLTEGEFPKYSQLIPEKATYTATVDRAAFIDLIAGVSSVAGADTPVRLSFAGGKLSASVTVADVGESVASIPVTMAGGWPTFPAVGFNPAYLLATAKVGQGDTLNIGLIDAKKPAVITDERGMAHLRLLMPVRLS